MPIAPARTEVAGSLVQRDFEVEADTFAGYLDEQKTNQTSYKQWPNDYPDVTTVGFEHEFAQMEGETLEGVSHLELSKSTQKAPLTDLPFTLETDASNELEMVSPPFLVATLPGQPIPEPSEIHKIDGLIKTRLAELVDDNPTLGQLQTELAEDPGLTFPLSDVTIGAENLSHNTKGDFYEGHAEVEASTLKAIKLEKSTKFANSNVETVDSIDSQINFATDAQGYDRMQKIHEGSGGSYDGVLLKAEKVVHDRLLEVVNDQGLTPSSELRLFLGMFARTLAGLQAVPAIENVRTTQQGIFEETSQVPRNQKKNKIKTGGQDAAAFLFNANMSSHVKDVRAVWLKDTPLNLAYGMLKTRDDWAQLHVIARNSSLRSDLAKLGPPASDFSGKAKSRYEENFRASRAFMVRALRQVQQAAKDLSPKKKWKEYSKSGATKTSGPTDRPDFMSHEEEFIAPRQDTFIPVDKAQMPNTWKRRLHVVEARGNPVAMLEQIKVEDTILGSDKNDATIAEGLKVLDATAVGKVRERLARRMIAEGLSDKTIAARIHLDKVKVKALRPQD